MYALLMPVYMIILLKGFTIDASHACTDNTRRNESKVTETSEMGHEVMNEAFLIQDLSLLLSKIHAGLWYLFVRY